jgi:hypothetical protein
MVLEEAMLHFRGQEDEVTVKPEVVEIREARPLSPGAFRRGNRDAVEFEKFRVDGRGVFPDRHLPEKEVVVTVRQVVARELLDKAFERY